MKWITRRNIHVDRTSCPWLIRRFIDPQAEFAFAEPNADPATLDGHTFDMRGPEYSHEGDTCTIQVMVTDVSDRRAPGVLWASSH